jgi:hypothetical protein
MEKMSKIPKEFVAALFEHVTPTGMPCQHCGYDYGEIQQIVNEKDETTELQITCTRCMRTFAAFEVF